VGADDEQTDVRRATPDDLDIVLELVAEYCEADQHPFDPMIARAGVEPLLTDDTHGAIWMIDDTDGYVAVTWGWSIEIGGHEVVLDELFVRTRNRGKGGRALAVIEQVCRDRGAKRIFLETELANEDARRLYERHGYVADTSVWMSKELP
jgi:GNAT superfamily N-acetyltransferase